MEGLKDQGKGGHASLNRRVFSGLQLSAIENTRDRMKAASHLFLISPTSNGWTVFKVHVNRTKVFKPTTERTEKEKKVQNQKNMAEIRGYLHLC